jgi:hypothetical protein
MFPLGHMGVGLKLAAPFDADLPKRPLLLGTLLPDLIDKPLYYGLSAWTGRVGAQLGLVAGTRSFGHTLVFTAALAALARARRSRAWAALALGAATHLVLDALSDAFTRGVGFSMRALLWPLLGWQFPAYSYRNWHDHLHHVGEPFLLGAEIAGGLFLLLEWRRTWTLTEGRTGPRAPRESRRSSRAAAP